MENPVGPVGARLPGRVTGNPSEPGDLPVGWPYPVPTGQHRVNPVMPGGDRAETTPPRRRRTNREFPRLQAVGEAQKELRHTDARPVRVSPGTHRAHRVIAEETERATAEMTPIPQRTKSRKSKNSLSNATKP